MGTAFHLDQAMINSRNRGKCTKMHAHLGPGFDGCQLFDGENPNDVLCGACGCHMSFHVKLNLGDSKYRLENHEVIDLEPGLKRCKMSFEASPAESVGDNLDSNPGVEVNSGTSQEDLLRVFRSNRLEEQPPVFLQPASIKPERDEIRVNDSIPLYRETPLYTKLCSKLKLIQAEYPEAIHGKFSIVHDDVHGYRVYCGGCDRHYGIPKPGYSLGNFERGHLASKRHKDMGAAQGKLKVQKIGSYSQQAPNKTMHFG
ncbi:uncharacterized protein [Physcomitrium patens]|uniref:ZF-HD dimerization-type domain-containing protein n=1 Tax=Physcomitrium patens TaxID=3218 RepID=A0A2K1K318_PHYPA|nr:uncharacterized protein LOC112287047 [Physcomitrium patens]PNR48166.1 hypothetical protein PHYPA_012641 [Physcomitrium patens]|eukprot:XP_024385427.1 uncharacterized protein LOC112287047 [Physcomitrella patens]